MMEHCNSNNTLTTSHSSEIIDSYDEVMSWDMLLRSIRHLNSEVNSKSVTKEENNYSHYSAPHMPRPRTVLNRARSPTFESAQSSYVLPCSSQSGALLTSDSSGDEENINDDDSSTALIDVNVM
jgi:hypothetical protein